MFRILFLLVAFLVLGAGLMAAPVTPLQPTAPAASSGPGTWFVDSQHLTHVIISDVGQKCTYRVHVDPDEGEVVVNVRDRNNRIVRSRSGTVPPGGSRDFALDQGFSIEVVHQGQDSKGTYETV